MTMRQFKFCVDSPGLDNDLVCLGSVPGYTVEQAAIRALCIITAKPENKNGPSFEIPLKLVETTRGVKHTAYYRIGICTWVKPDIEETYEYALASLIKDEEVRRRECELVSSIIPNYRYQYEVYRVK